MYRENIINGKFSLEEKCPKLSNFNKSIVTKKLFILEAANILENI
jgi:hypothetical protein